MYGTLDSNDDRAKTPQCQVEGLVIGAGKNWGKGPGRGNGTGTDEGKGENKSKAMAECKQDVSARLQH